MRRRALLGRGQRPGQTLGLAAQQPLQPSAPLAGRGKVDVFSDAGDREAELLRAEARIEGRDELTDAFLRSLRALGRSGQRAPDRQIGRRALLHPPKRPAELDQRAM